jgi:NlpC/P60 family
MNSRVPWRVQSAARIGLFVSVIRRVPSSLERLDSSLKGVRLFSSGLTPRVSRLHLGALAACFVAASFWVAFVAKGQTGHSRGVAKQSAQEQSQNSSSASDLRARQDAQAPEAGQPHQTGQSQPAPYKPIPRYRMLTLKDEQAIVKAARGHNADDTDVRDCSHTVHQIYEAAGYEYPYASSFDLYRGTANFVRVTHPQPGDLIAWPGHVGIVLNAKRHSFYSLVSTGLEAQDYRGRYWRGRGHPRFYRYIVERPAPSQRPEENLAPARAQQR